MMYVLCKQSTFGDLAVGPFSFMGEQVSLMRDIVLRDALECVCYTYADYNSIHVSCAVHCLCILCK